MYVPGEHVRMIRLQCTVPADADLCLVFSSHRGGQGVVLVVLLTLSGGVGRVSSGGPGGCAGHCTRASRLVGA